LKFTPNPAPSKTAERIKISTLPARRLVPSQSRCKRDEVGSLNGEGVNLAPLRNYLFYTKLSPVSISSFKSNNARFPYFKNCFIMSDNYIFKVERFRVQRSGLISPQANSIRKFLSSSCLFGRFTQWGTSVIPNFDQYCVWCPSVITFAPWSHSASPKAVNLEP